jgi:hypothetical protein
MTTFRDNPPNADYWRFARSPIVFAYTLDKPDIHAVIADLRLVAEQAS